MPAHCCARFASCTAAAAAAAVNWNIDGLLFDWPVGDPLGLVPCTHRSVALEAILFAQLLN